MKIFTLGLILTSLSGPPKAPAADWQDLYASGLKACHQSHWDEARNDFMEADRLRRGDIERPTLTPSSPADPGRWRNGSPYSPRFLSAYCEYRVALENQDATAQASEFETAAHEMEKLVKVGERSRAALFYLDLIYSRLNLKDKETAFAAEKGHRGRKHDFKVDEEPLAPEEVSAMQMMEISPQEQSAPISPQRMHAGPTVGSITTPPQGQYPHMPTTAGAGPLMPSGGKYALVVGEDGHAAAKSDMSFASYDAGVVKDGLTNFAGYEPGNVFVIQNGTSAEIMEKARALAAKLPQDAVVLFFFAGPGVNIQGKDYLAASDTTSRFDVETMVSKASLYQLFFLKGARLFSFYEVSRPIDDGSFFGAESATVGSVAQMEATIPGDDVSATVANGHIVGVYAESFIDVLSDLKSAQIPIYEFGWQLYNKMRRGNTGQQGGGSHQTCTLPVLNNLASDARF